ncbi:hypothetical protein ACHAWO_009204 [Cyclotella atomus]|uniref:Uncharacterized protein n=1 Tax=Cyclotella atomus TaxID=382360 RepID=A0ABD3P246_9STRA
MATYRRVADSDGEATRTKSDDALNQAPSRSRGERISDKLHALAWAVSAYFIARYTQLFHTILTDERILRPVLNLSITLFSINAALISYLTIYLPCIKFRKLANTKLSACSSAFWDVYCPRVIPAMTVCGLFGSFLLVRACYPVWGFLTPLMLGWVALGAFFSLHFIPWC